MRLNVRAVSLVAAGWCILLGVSAAMLPYKLQLEGHIAARVADAASSGNPEAQLTKELARERVAETSDAREYQSYSVVVGALLLGISTWFGYAAFLRREDVSARALILAVTVAGLLVADSLVWQVPARYSVVRGKVGALVLVAVLVWAAARGRPNASQRKELDGRNPRDE